MKPFEYLGRTLVLLAALGFGSGMLIGCEDEGPAEGAGEALDDAADDAGDAVDDAADDVEDSMD